jgi:hypothetical protein
LATPQLTVLMRLVRVTRTGHVSYVVGCVQGRLTDIPIYLNSEMAEGIQSILRRFYDDYVQNTSKKLKIIDAYVLYILLTGILQFAYCCLVGTFPFNSFLSGFISTVGSFVLAGEHNAVNNYEIYDYFSETMSSADRLSQNVDVNEQLKQISRRLETNGCNDYTSTCAVDTSCKPTVQCESRCRKGFRCWAVQHRLGNHEILQDQE